MGDRGSFVFPLVGGGECVDEGFGWEASAQVGGALGSRIGSGLLWWCWIGLGLLLSFS